MTSAGEPSNPLERLFLEHLGTIDQVLRKIARRNALARDDADDFFGHARLRLIEDNYRVLRKFEGRSSMATYLNVVLTHEYSSYRNSLWGRWRPSAAAQRIGPVGIRLEQLLTRDKCTLSEAIGILRSAGVEATDAELRRMAASLPVRTDDEEVPLDGLEQGIADRAQPDNLELEERERVSRELRTAIESMPEEDRLITRMRFWDNMSVADIARTLRLEQKPLYLRLKSICRRLLEALRRAGISDDVARDLLREDDA